MKKSEALQILSQIISPTYNQTNNLQSIISSLTKNDWQKIISIANRYHITPSIYPKLKEKNLLKSIIDDKQLLRYIQEMYNLNSLRNKNILKQVSEICELLYMELAIEVVLLKGVSALSEAHYKDIGERVMLDIDILVPEENIFEAIDILKQNGYSEIEPKELEIEWHHYNRLYHPDKMASIEIHRYPLGENSPFPRILTKEHLIKSKSIKNSYVLNPTYEILHSFLHTQLSHGYHKKYLISLRHLQHFSTMITLYNQKIDYKIIDKFMKKNNLNTIWNEYIYMIDELFSIEDKTLISYAKNNQKYIYKVYYFLNNSIKLRFFIIKSIIKKMFSHKNLNKHYNIKSGVPIFVYIPIHLILSIKKFLFNTKVRNNIKKMITNLY